MFFSKPAGSSGGRQTAFKATGSGRGAQELGTRSSSKSSLEGYPKHTEGAGKRPGCSSCCFQIDVYVFLGVGECVVFWERERCFFMVLLLLTLSCWWNHGTSWNIICRLPWGPFWGRFRIPGTKKKSSRSRRNPEEATGSSGGHIQWTLFDATTCLGLLLSPEIRVVNRKRWKDIGRRKLNDGRRWLHDTWHCRDWFGCCIVIVERFVPGRSWGSGDGSSN